VNNILIVQGDIGFAQRSAISCIKSGIPLFVFIAETNNGDITAFSMDLYTYGIYLC